LAIPNAQASVWATRTPIAFCIGQNFTKGANFRQVIGAELRNVVRKLNDSSRKRLAYRASAKVFLGGYSGALKTAGAALIA
jgi:hypothetical protein